MTEKYAIELKCISLVGVAIIVYLLFRYTHLPDHFCFLNHSFMILVERLGFGGIFVIAPLGNLAVFVQGPYTILFLSRALGGASLLLMILLGATSELGAGLGKIIR